MLKKILILSFFLGSAAAYAQVSPSVRGGQSTLWAGGMFSSFNPDFDPTSRLVGIGVLVDYNLTQRFGAEGEARWLHWNGAGGQTQSNYLVGPKARLFQYHRFSFNAKFLLGGVWITYPDSIGSGSYFAYAPGGYVDYRISRRFSVRGDYEYQILPAAPGLGGPSHGLTPHGFSVGVTYRILGVR
ncbi:MAG TPA: outer membrane beta-barrel protein [Silvibacterium sp.]|nr:outer membrane beta-barrel protein [Silvibacterium sp.]